MSAMTTRAPSSSNASTSPRPTPAAPPVTTPTLPRRSVSALPSATPAHLVLVLPPLGPPDVVGRRDPRAVLAEVVRRRPDLLRDRAQRREVEAVATSCRLSEHLAGVVDRHIAEVVAETRDGVGPGAFGMRIVRAPHRDVTADAVPAADLFLRHGRRAHEDVLAEVLRRQLREDALHQRGH